MKIQICFIQSITKRRLQNNVYAINDAAGMWKDNINDVNDAFLECYKSLLGSTMENKENVKDSFMSKEHQ